MAHIPFEAKAPNGERRREIARTDETDHSGAKSVFDSRSLQLMRVKMRGADAGVLANTVRNFEQSIAADTALNEKLRQTIHQWLSSARRPTDLAVLTNRIYDELFLSPRADPWLGLVVPDAFTAIEGDAGVVASAGTLTGLTPSAVVAGIRTPSKVAAERPALKTALDWKPAPVAGSKPDTAAALKPRSGAN